MGTDIYFLLGIKRSGNHAILNWLYKMIPNWVHMNNMPINRLNSSQYKLNLTTLPLKQKYVDNRWIPFQSQNTLIISFEDQDLKVVAANISKFCKETNLTPHIGILTRSPQNNLASAYKVFKQNTSILAKYTTLWQRYATEAMDKTNFKENGLVIHPIFYDKWFENKKYREEWATNFGLKFDDGNKNSIFKHGTSSFDKMKYKNDASKMDVLNRAASFEKDPNFSRFVNNERTQTLWKKYKKLQNWEK